MKTTDQQTADTLFAFQMALKGHKQFEWKSTLGGAWMITDQVTSRHNYRIYHDLPSPEWTRHDGDDWSSDKDAVIEEAMFCDGFKTEANKPASYYSSAEYFKHDSPHHRIYAYKLAKQTPTIPKGIPKKVVPWTLQTIPSPLPELVQKASGEICTIAVVKLEGVLINARGYYSYDQILEHFTQRQSGEVCGTEEV